MTMITYKAPGVYFEWQDPPPPITRARTDIAGFVGVARRGPLFQPVKVESWQQFLAAFGSYTPQGYLTYAVSGFFANGGRTCWVVRVANPNFATCAALNLTDANGNVIAWLEATSEGTWAHEMTVTALAGLAGSFTVILRLPTGEEEIWRDLSAVQPDPTIQNGPRTAEAMNGLPGNEKRPPTPGSFLLHSVKPFPDGRSLPSLSIGSARQMARPSGGGDGLYYLHPEHLLQGLQCLGEIPEVAAIAMPDMFAPPYRPEPWPTYQRYDCSQTKLPDDPSDPRLAPLQPLTNPDHPQGFNSFEIEYLIREMISQCEKLKDRVAILTVPPAEEEPQVAVAWRNQFDSSYAALYTPWLRVQDAGGPSGQLLPVPPVGHVAGVYAQTDTQVGPHKPPANVEVAGTQDVTRPLDDLLHGYLNDASINAIRSYPGRGIRIFGARTLSSDSAWRFLNVRRLLLMIERSLLERTQWLVFEPNNPTLWINMERVIRNFLRNAWEDGLLDGATANDAYQVICNATSNPPEQTERGHMITVITLNPPAPAEFVIVRIGKTEAGAEILEG
jgi:uncharacterized protein